MHVHTKYTVYTYFQVYIRYVFLTYLYIHRKTYTHIYGSDKNKVAYAILVPQISNFFRHG